MLQEKPKSQVQLPIKHDEAHNVVTDVSKELIGTLAREPSNEARNFKSHQLENLATVIKKTIKLHNHKLIYHRLESFNYLWNSTNPEWWQRSPIILLELNIVEAH